MIRHLRTSGRAPCRPTAEQVPENRKLLSVKDIVAFADEVAIPDVAELLQRQIDDNLAIVEASLTARDGMRSTDKEVIRLMLNNDPDEV